MDPTPRRKELGLNRPPSFFINVPGNGHSVRQTKHPTTQTPNKELSPNESRIPWEIESAALLTTYSTIHPMKPTPFDGNDNGMLFEYHRSREGPNVFVCKYKQSAVLRIDPKDAWRVLGAAKFTDTGKRLKEWCLEMDEKYGADQKEARVDTSFASEVQQEEEPNDNTKMVV